MGGGGNGNGLLPEGVAFENRNCISSRLRMVTPGYFETMRIPIVRAVLSRAPTARAHSRSW